MNILPCIEPFALVELHLLVRWIIPPSRISKTSCTITYQASTLTFHFYINYRALNNISIKNRYTLPLISETLNKLSKVVIFTKLDIISVFNRIRMVEGHEWIIILRIRYGLFKSLVLSFRLYKRPSIF